MSAYKTRCVFIACGLAALLLMPAAIQACCFLDCLFGKSACAAPQTTYMPVYAPQPCAAPVCAAPTDGCSTCAPQVVQYAPYTGYRPIYTALTVPRPVTTYYYPTAAYSPTPACNSCAAPTTAYYPAAPCSPCAAPVAAYRPVVAWTQQVRMIPYTTYRVPSMPVTYVGYAPAAASYASPCVSACASPCSTYGSCGTVSYSGAATYASPSDSCQPAVSSTYVTPSTQAPSYSAPATTTVPSTESTQQPQTFQSQTPPALESKPIYPENNTTSPNATPSSNPDSNLTPVPETRFNTSPGPQLQNPENRTTSSPVRQAIYLVNRPAQLPTAAAIAPAPKTTGWQEWRD